MIPRIVVVTARRRLVTTDRPRDWERPLEEFIRGAVAGGADLIQVREPDLEAGPLTRFLRRLFASLPEARSRVVVNERVDVAAAVEAAGVHLPERSLLPAQARVVLPTHQEWVVGRSVHSIEAVQASQGASYLIAGTVLDSLSKPPGIATIGWQGLGRLTAAAGAIPVVAIGGMTDREVPQAVAAGASGVAAVGYFVPAGRTDLATFVQERVTKLRLVFDTLGSVSYTRNSDR